MNAVPQNEVLAMMKGLTQNKRNRTDELPGVEDALLFAKVCAERNSGGNPQIANDVQNTQDHLKAMVFDAKYRKVIKALQKNEAEIYNAVRTFICLPEFPSLRQYVQYQDREGCLLVRIEFYNSLKDTELWVVDMSFDIDTGLTDASAKTCKEQRFIKNFQDVTHHPLVPMQKAVVDRIKTFAEKLFMGAQPAEKTIAQQLQRLSDEVKRLTDLIVEPQKADANV